MSDGRGAVVVTGGCGFIGSRLALALADGGVAVRVVDIAPPPADLRDRCPVEVRDIRDRDAMRGAFEGADAVVHCAGALGRQCDADPDIGWETNVTGTVHVLDEIAASRTAPRLVFLGTGGVYAPGDRYPLDEGARIASRNLYTATKLAGEALVAAAALRAGLAAIVLRLFTVYGPGPSSGRRGHFIAGWLERMVGGQPLIVHGAGTQTIDATHVVDVVRAIRLALAAPVAAGVCRVYNIGSGRETAIVEVARCLRAVEPQIEVVHVPPPAVVPARQFADIGRARAELGYVPTIDPHAGLTALARAACERGLAVIAS